MSSLLLRYKHTEDDDPSLYFNPGGKRERISNAIEELKGKLTRVEETNPSFDEVEQLAEDIALQCRTPDAAPVFQQTKEQIYAEIVQELAPLVKEELIGKYLCYKTGTYDFAYFKCERVDVRVGMYNRLEIQAGGPGFAVDTALVPSCFHGHVFPDFKDFFIGVKELLLTGKSDYTKTWLYVLSEAEYRKQFDKAVAGIAKNIGLTQEETEQEGQPDA